MKQMFQGIWVVMGLTAALTLGGCSAGTLDMGSLFKLGSSGPWAAEFVGVVREMDVPMCVAVDAEGFAYVSNIEAEDSSAYWLDDGSGFIARLLPGGQLETLRWKNSNPQTVMNSAKGMCILDGQLYVADNSRIVRFALNGNGPGEIINVPGTPQLADLATDGQAIYAADGRRNVIVRIEGKSLSYLRGPNGLTALAFFDGRLFAVSSAQHDVYEIDLSGSRAPTALGLADHFGGLGGIETLPDGTLIVADFVQNKVSAIAPDLQSVTTLVELSGPALIGVDPERDLLYVPQFTSNQVSVFRLQRG